MKRGRVLVVEDDEQVRSVLSCALRLDGHEVVALASAEQAWDGCLADAPAVVLLDVMLPGMSGLQLLVRLRRHAALRAVPVLLLSARTDRSVVLEGLRGGAQDYIAKPFDVEEVLARVQVAVDATRAQDALRRRVATLERAALTDELTGLDNRRAAQRQLRRLAAESARAGDSLALLMVDVDRFKDVNDTYGHATGDAVLTRLAQQLVATARTGDMVARWGGEEFVVLMRRTALPEARVAAERLRASVAHCRVPSAGAAPMSTPVTVSVGAAVTGTGDVRQLVIDADTALYEAKAAGRNRVAVAAAHAAGRGSFERLLTVAQRPGSASRRAGREGRSA